MRLILIVTALSLLPLGAWAQTHRSRKNTRTVHRRTAVRARARPRSRAPARVTRTARVARPVPHPMARAAPRVQAPMRGPASFRTGVVESDKSFNVTGQARSINMTLVLKGDKDEIHFVKPRTSFQDKLGEDRF